VAAGGHAVVTGTCEGSVIADGGDLVITGAVTDASVERLRAQEGHQTPATSTGHAA
jgi:hypothetical protein